jgi:hypothetical protein
MSGPFPTSGYEETVNSRREMGKTGGFLARSWPRDGKCEVYAQVGWDTLDPELRLDRAHDGVPVLPQRFESRCPDLG